jgi:hypothetical protein
MIYKIFRFGSVEEQFGAETLTYPTGGVLWEPALGVEADICCPLVMQARVAALREQVPDMVIKIDMGVEGTGDFTGAAHRFVALLEQMWKAQRVTRTCRLTWNRRDGPS